ncbi:FkbM family methyltransferase [Dyadobacter sandarakinus]|uniref:FkbM family methyltransferase n=1 Tax=Dyadobacter sandarakinus TaxID=2747268 RepID=A0ABX7I9S4_9BACT|nr:FkbM family methyltransferase [Dyadobacter sandarakinus]QRR01923.1 FkbM family methyltransferase [Dyadobacter sandarakinus]
MIKQIKGSLWSILNKVGVGGSLQLVMSGALKQYGWFKSYNLKQSVDAQGQPIPWYTYPFIRFLEPRLSPDLNVFEYGSGNSTQWYAARVKHITAVEHDSAWVTIVRKKLPSNAELREEVLGDSYIQAVAAAGKKYDIIIVDGRKRVKCACYAADFLSEKGVLILDNAEREWYQPAKDYLRDKGFRRLDFIGMTPIVGIETCTSVFYRDQNCLGI